MNYLLSVCAGFLVGIVVSYFILSDSTLLFCLILSVVLFIYTKFFERDYVRTAGFIVSIFFLGIFLGQFRVLAFNHSIPRNLERFESQNISLVGKIISEPVSNGQTQKFTVSVSQVDSQTESGRLLVITDLFPQYHYGDVISIKGQLKKPEKVAEDNGKIFDYPSYLLKDKITETMSFAKIQSTGKNEGNILIKSLYSIKEKFVAGMQNVLPEPEAGLMAGITLGTQTISKNLSDNFRTAGLSHIVVLSGYNITVVSNFVMAIALYFSVASAAFLAIFSVILFVLMSGASASAMRAGIMSIVALLGKRFGKSYSAGRALFLAVFAMILWNPMTLLFDPSFHLSVLATVAMIYFSPIVFARLKFVTKRYELRDILATTLAVNFFVLPYILYMSGNIQILSLPANMLVLPFVPVTMFLGLLVGLLGLVSRFLGLIVGIPSYIILYYDIFIAQSVSSLSFAQISIPDFSLIPLLAIYILFFYFLYKSSTTFSEKVVLDKKNSVANPVVSSALLLGPTDRQNPIVTSDGYTVIGD